MEVSGQNLWRIRMLLLHGAMFVAPIGLVVTDSILRPNAMGFCVIKSICGFDCPGCGITHSAIALYEGNMQESFKFHPAGPVILVILGLLLFYFLFSLLMNYKAVHWQNELKIYSTLEVTAMSLLIGGWLIKFFI